MEQSRKTHKLYENQDIQIQVWDTGQDKEFWKGSLDQFIKDNPDDLDSKTMRQVRDGYKIFIGGGASPEFSIQKIDEAHVRKITDGKVFYISIECSIPEEFQKIHADLSDDYNQLNFKWNPAFNEAGLAIDVTVQAPTWDEALAEVFDYLRGMGIETDNSVEVIEQRKSLKEIHLFESDFEIALEVIDKVHKFCKDTKPTAIRTIAELNSVYSVVSLVNIDEINNHFSNGVGLSDSRKLTEKDNWKSSRRNPENEGEVVIEAGDSYKAYVTVHCFSDQEADNVVALIKKQMPTFTKMHPRWRDADGTNMVLEFDLNVGGHNDQDILDSVLEVLDDSDINLLWEVKNKKGNTTMKSKTKSQKKINEQDTYPAGYSRHDDIAELQDVYGVDALFLLDNLIAALSNQEAFDNLSYIRRMNDIPSYGEDSSIEESKTKSPNQILIERRKAATERMVEAHKTSLNEQDEENNLPEWLKIAIDELAAFEGLESMDFTEIRENGRGYSVSGAGEGSSGESEWDIYETWEDAEYDAENSVKQDLAYEPEVFTQSWLQHYIIISPTDRRMIAVEDADNTVDDLDLEELQELYEIEIGDPPGNEKDSEDLIDEITSHMSDRIEKELEDPINYFVEELGICSIDELMKMSFISIDIERAAKDALETDGVAHFLDRYDGYETELDSGAYAFGTN